MTWSTEHDIDSHPRASSERSVFPTGRENAAECSATGMDAEHDDVIYVGQPMCEKISDLPSVSSDRASRPTAMICVILFSVGMLMYYDAYVSISLSSQSKHTLSEMEFESNATVVPFCDMNLQNIFIGANHKTGTDMFCTDIGMQIQRFWKRRCLSLAPSAVQSNGYLRHVSIGPKFLYHRDDHINAKKIKRFVEARDSGAHLVIMQIMREPVDTVLSGYNYHQKPVERWLQNPLSAHTRCGAGWHRFLDKMKISKQMSLLELYHESNTTFGLWVELERYSNCGFKNIVGAFEYMHAALDKAENIDAHSFRFEDFKANWTGTVDVLLDLIGIFGEDRQSLAALLDKVNIWDAEWARHKSTKHMRKHITAGTFDKAAQTEVLLGNEHRCQMLKKQTLSLDYNWKYALYC